MRESQVFNIEAEAQVLGAILLNSDLINKVGEALQPEHFYAAHNADLYRQIKILVNDGRIPTPPALKSRLSDALYPDGNATVYMMQIIRNHGTAIEFIDHARLIADLGIRRKLCETVDGIKYNAVRSDEVPTKKLIDDIDASISDLRASCQQDEETPEFIDDVSKDCIQHMRDLMQGKIAPPPSTGLIDLDKRIGGWGKGRYYVVGGRPAQGKTIFGVSSMRKVVEQKTPNGRYGAMYISLEIKNYDVWSRLVSEYLATKGTPIHYNRIQKAQNLTPEEAERTILAAEYLEKLPIRFVTKPGMTMLQIEAKARETKQLWAKKGQTLDVVFIDYLGLIKASDRYRGSKTQEITEISGDLLGMASRLDISVVALSQLSRGVENRENKIPNMADLRDSGAIEQDANSIVFLCRPAYYKAKEGPVGLDEETQLILNVDKARDGETGLINAYIDVANNYITNMGH